MGRRIWAAALACLLWLTACAPHYDETNIHRLYDAGWIAGKTRAEIVKKYGAFDREYTLDTGENVGAYYVNYDKGPLDASYIHDTYFVFFDDAGIALKSEFRETSIGG